MLVFYKEVPVLATAMKEACHHNLYAIANSQAMNGIGADTTIKAVEPSIIGTCRTGAIVFWVIFVATLALYIVKKSKFKKSEEFAAYKAAKAEYKASK